jgi:hypothetical protein
MLAVKAGPSTIRNSVRDWIMAGRGISLRSALVVAIGGLARRAVDLPQESLASDPRALKLAENVLTLLGVDDRCQSVRIDRRGRPRTHDMEFAQVCLLEMAIESPDGLPSKQWRLAARLRDRIAEAGKPLPGDTWLSKVVGQFYASVNRLTREAISHYRASEDLQRTFGDEAAYVAWRKACELAERRWRASIELQEHFTSLHDYVRHRAETTGLRAMQLCLPANIACTNVNGAAPLISLPGVLDASLRKKPLPSAGEIRAFYSEIAATWSCEPGIEKVFANISAYTTAREADYCRANAVGLEQLRGETNVSGEFLRRLARSGRSPSVNLVATVNASYDAWLASADIRAEFISFDLYASRLLLNPATGSTEGSFLEQAELQSSCFHVSAHSKEHLS